VGVLQLQEAGAVMLCLADNAVDNSQELPASHAIIRKLRCFLSYPSAHCILRKRERERERERGERERGREGGREGERERGRERETLIRILCVFTSHV
jgi:hypothetical protein